MAQLYTVFLILLGFCLTELDAIILSQFRGENRDGVYTSEKLLKQWPASGPKLIWSAEGFGIGFSSVAATSEHIYLTGMIDGEGFLFALDMDGKLIWKSNYGPEWESGRPGARTTPTVVDDKIYLMSAEGQVVCLNSQDGKQIWSVDLIESFGARNLRWGMAESLLIDGDRLFCTPGGTNVFMAILNRNTGETIQKIKTNGELSGYCSPTLIKHGEKRLILTMSGRSVVGLDAESGQYLCQHSHITQYDINPNTPLYHDGFIYTVSGYGTGGQLFKLSPAGNKLEQIWANETLDSQMGATMLVDGYIYGSGQDNKGWHCIDWKTGKVQYTSRDLGSKGNIIFADELLYCYSEKGDVGLVKPNPNKFEIISSFKIRQGSGEHWAHPVVHQGRLFVRHGDTLLAYDIARK
jgi:outer membrane protein assembly factor BamB